MTPRQPEPVLVRRASDGSVVWWFAPGAAPDVERAVERDRRRQRDNGGSWAPTAAALIRECEAETKSDTRVVGVVPVGLVTACFSAGIVDRMTTAEAAEVLGFRGPRRVQQLVRDRVLSSPARGFVFRAEVELLAARRGGV